MTGLFLSHPINTNHPEGNLRDQSLAKYRGQTSA